MARKRVSVTRETPSGRNIEYRDNYNGNIMNRPEFVRQIRQGSYDNDNYHVRLIDGIPTPCSNPDNSKNNNLG